MSFGNESFGISKFGFTPQFYVANQLPVPNSGGNPRLFVIEFDIISLVDPVDISTIILYASNQLIINDGYSFNGQFIIDAYGRYNAIGSIDATDPNNIHVTAGLVHELASNHIDMFVSAFTTGGAELSIGNIWSFDALPVTPGKGPHIINVTPTPGSIITTTPSFTFTIKTPVPIDFPSVFINFNNEIVVDGYYINSRYSVSHTVNIDGVSADYTLTPLYTLPSNVTAFISLQISCLDIYGQLSQPFIAAFLLPNATPVLLVPIYPLDRQIDVPVNSTIHFLLNKFASATGLDITTLNVQINGATAIVDGYFQTGFDGYFSNINPGIGNFDAIEVVINQFPLLFNNMDIVTVNVQITSLDPVLYSSWFSFITEDSSNALLTTPPTPVFAGYFQGIYYAGSLGDGYHARLTWHPARTTMPNYDLAYIIYYSQQRTNVFSEGPKLTTLGRALPNPELTDGNDAQMYGFYTDITMPVGTEYYYAVRATEFSHTAIPVVPPDGYSPFANGLTVVDGYSFAVPQVMQLINSANTGNITVVTAFTPGYSTLGGYLNINGEIVRYSSASISGDNYNFIIMSSGRGLFGTEEVAHAPGEPVGAFLGNIDDNTVIAQTVVHWEDYNRFDPHRTRPDLETTNFILEDGYNTGFEPYDYCGWHTPRIDTLLNGGDCKSYIGGNFGGFKNFDIYQQMLNREEMLLEATGEPVFLLKRIWSGEKCPCVLSRRESSRVRSCTLCFGTGFKGGYVQYLNPRRIDKKIMLRFDPADEDLQLGAQSGFAQDYKPIAWTIAIPSVKDRDIVIRYNEFGELDFAYEVLKVSRTKQLFNKWERQKVALQRLDKTHIIYQFVPVFTTAGLIGNGAYVVQNGITSTNDFQLTDTNNHIVASLLPQLSGNFIVLVYYRVLGATSLNITITWSDASGPQSVNPVNDSQSPGSYTMTPVYINAFQRTPITVIAQASDPNLIFISASITSV